MRRIAALVAVLGSALGCHHVGGSCDCQAHPSDAVMPAPSTPYPATPLTGGVVAPVAAPVRVPEKVPVAPVNPMPPMAK